jgi:hypothetical protein
MRMNLCVKINNQKMNKNSNENLCTKYSPDGSGRPSSLVSSIKPPNNTVREGSACQMNPSSLEFQVNF